jgi:phage terminase Nu1 subunit (DNA packaging protein)
MTTATPPRLVNARELAAEVGVHPDRIGKWAAQGMPVVRRGRHGEESAYDLAACVQWIEGKRTILSPKDLYYLELRDKVRRENALRAGTVMDTATAERRWAAEVIRARDGVLGVVSKLRTRDPDVTVRTLTILDGLLREALDALAGDEEDPDGATAAPETNGHARPPRRGPRPAGGRPPRRGGEAPRGNAGDGHAYSAGSTATADPE